MHGRTTALRNPRTRSHQRARRTVLQLPPHAARRRGRQGRTAGQGRSGPQSRPRPGAQPGRYRRLLPRPERRQEIPRTRSQGPCRPSRLRGPGPRCGRPPGQLPGRGAGPDGVRRRPARRAQPTSGELCDHRLRAVRADEHRPRLRPDHPGTVRDDEHHRHHRHRSSPGGLPRLRLARRTRRGPRDQRGAPRAGADRAGRTAGRLHAGGLPLRDGLGRLQLPCQRGGSGADGRPERHRRAVGNLRDRGRRPEHRGQPTGAVRHALPTRRTAGAGRRSAVRRARGTQAAPRRAQHRTQHGTAPKNRPGVGGDPVLGRSPGGPGPDGSRGRGARTARAPRLLHRPALPGRLGPHPAGQRQRRPRGRRASPPASPPPLLDQHGEERTTLIARWRAHGRTAAEAPAS